MATETPNTATQPVVVQAKPLDNQSKVDPNSVASSDMPYHTANTEKAAEKNAKSVKESEPKDFTLEINGYVLKAKEAEDTQKGFADEEGLVYEVTAEENKGFIKVFGSKRDATIFVQTHSRDFANQTAEMPSA